LYFGVQPEVFGFWWWGGNGCNATAYILKSLKVCRRARPPPKVLPIFRN